jgi:hypothetical protein
MTLPELYEQIRIEAEQIEATRKRVIRLRSNAIALGEAGMASNIWAAIDELSWAATKLKVLAEDEP